MKALFQVIKENVSNFYLIIRLSFFELKSGNNGNYLGILWEVLNPMILIGIYWFVFGFGIRGGKSVEGVEFLPWMLAGICPWFFISQVITQGSKSIYSRLNVVSKMNFPMSVIPTYVIASKFYSHAILVGLVMIVLAVYGYYPSLYLLQFPYFIIANLLLMSSISLVTSTLSTIIRDIQNIVQSVVRGLMFITPILWSTEKLPTSVVYILKLNPIYYIVEGYRSSLLGKDWYFAVHHNYTLYFWCLVLGLLLAGSSLHVKFRKRFVDYI